MIKNWEEIVITGLIKKRGMLEQFRVSSSKIEGQIGKSEAPNAAVDPMIRYYRSNSSPTIAPKSENTLMTKPEARDDCQLSALFNCFHEID